MKKDKKGLGGVLLGATVGGYAGYKIGRAKPQKKGFETEKKIAEKVSKKFKEKKKPAKSMAKGGKLNSIMTKKDIGLVIPKTYQIGDEEFGHTYKVEAVNNKKYRDDDDNRHYNFRIWEFDKDLNLFDELKHPSAKIKALERIERSKDNYAKGGSVSDSPRIYVASLSDYNNGRLEGEWIDFDDYNDGEEIIDAIKDMLEELNEKYKDGEVREEWAVHDYEGFPSSFYSEYMGEEDFQQIYDIKEYAEDRNIPIDVLMERAGDVGGDDYENISESLMMVVDGYDESDIVYQYEDEVGDLGTNFWQYYIYVDDVTNRVMTSEDMDRYREDLEYEGMSEEEAEEKAEEMADEESQRRRDDLEGYLEEMGYEDTIPNWVTKDYQKAWDNGLSYDFDVIHYKDTMYVFSNNYAKGGEISDLIVGKKVGHLRPHNGRYEYSEIIEINGNVVKLVHRHPTKRYWDNYFEMGKDEIKEFIDTPSKDFKDGRPLMKIKKSYAKGGELEKYLDQNYSEKLKSNNHLSYEEYDEMIDEIRTNFKTNSDEAHDLADNYLDKYAVQVYAKGGSVGGFFEGELSFLNF